MGRELGQNLLPIKSNMSDVAHIEMVKSQKFSRELSDFA